MSNSQYHRNCSGTAGENTCVNPCPPKYIACQSPDEDLHPAPCPAILQCGTVGDPKIVASTPVPVYVASVDIDTTCLCFPNLKIEFSTLLDLDATAAGGTMTIQLIRTCSNNPNNPIILKTYTITSPVETGTLPFNFIYCSQNAPSRYCTYTVKVTSATGFTSIQFNSTAIAAFAVGCQRIC